MDSARRTILVATAALLSMGLVMVYSASFVFAERKFGAATYFLQRHAIYLLGGCMALAVGALLDYHRLSRHWRWFIALAIILLGAVLIPGLGTKLNGARRWFSFAGMTVQPSEIVKPLMIMGLAGWIVHARDKIGTLGGGFLPGAVITSVVVILTAMEPDLGSACLLTVVFVAMLFAGGVKLRFAVPALLLTLPIAALLAYSKFSHIRARIESFTNGLTDPLGVNYQVTQGLIAQGSGGIFGAGLGQGHSKLLFLPEAHNDFIFALIGEEFGLIGTLFLLSLFALLVIQGWRVASRAPDLLGSLIALGVTLCIGLQAAINIAVVTHSVPTKGIALPLVSYGGSSLVFTLFLIGMLMNVAAHTSGAEIRSAPSRRPARRTDVSDMQSQPA